MLDCANIAIYWPEYLRAEGRRLRMPVCPYWNRRRGTDRPGTRRANAAIWRSENRRSIFIAPRKAGSHVRAESELPGHCISLEFELPFGLYKTEKRFLHKERSAERFGQSAGLMTPPSINRCRHRRWLGQRLVELQSCDVLLRAHGKRRVGHGRRDEPFYQTFTAIT